LDTLEKAKVISIDSNTGLITWLESVDYEDRVSIRNACLEDVVYKVGNNFAVAHIKPDIFDAFSNVKVLTYLSQFSLLYKYFEVVGKPVAIKTLANGTVSNNHPLYTGVQFSHLIDVDSTVRRNSMTTSLSTRGMLSIKAIELDSLKSHIGGFFQEHRTGVAHQERMWTTYKKYADKLKGNQAKPLHDSSNFVQHSSKGTNSYQDVKIAAYIINKHMHPGVIQFLKDHNKSYPPKSATASSGLDMWALSEMLQWIWRSRIRKGHSIKLYVPSERMRDLLKKWLGQ